jgi:hypothetical protein
MDRDRGAAAGNILEILALPESVERSNRRPDRPNRITQAQFSTLTWRHFARQVKNWPTLLMIGGKLGCGAIMMPFNQLA